MDIQPLRARYHGEEFEHYVEHALKQIDRRLNMEGSTQATLGQDVAELADAIPRLAAALDAYAADAKSKEVTLQDAISAKEAAVQQAAGDEAQITQLNQELAKAAGELEAIQASTEALTPVAERAQEVAAKLPPAPAVPEGTAATPDPATPGATGNEPAGAEPAGGVAGSVQGGTS